jgi:Helix-turn-helix domain
MSERDVKRLQVLAEVRAGKRTVVSAAAVLDLGVRQTFRLMSRYEAGGAGALIHKARGFQSPVERRHPGVRGRAGANEVLRLRPYPRD